VSTVRPPRDIPRLDALRRSATHARSSHGGRAEHPWRFPASRRPRLRPAKPGRPGEKLQLFRGSAAPRAISTFALGMEEHEPTIGAIAMGHESGTRSSVVVSRFCRTSTSTFCGRKASDRPALRRSVVSVSEPPSPKFHASFGKHARAARRSLAGSRIAGSSSPPCLERGRFFGKGASKGPLPQTFGAPRRSRGAPLWPTCASSMSFIRHRWLPVEPWPRLFEWRAESEERCLVTVAPRRADGDGNRHRPSPAANHRRLAVSLNQTVNGENEKTPAQYS